MSAMHNPVNGCCGACKWAVRLSTYYDTFQCRRGRPIGSGAGYGEWPSVSASAWCGEFADREAGPVEAQP